MSRTAPSVIRLALCLILYMNAPADAFDANKFSIEAPPGWIVQKENENSVTFIMPEAKDEEVYISISGTPTGSVDLDAAWMRIRPFIIKEGTLISEGEEIFSEVRWKKIQLHQIVCGYKMRVVVMFTIRNRTKYMIQFTCPEDRDKNLVPIFASVLRSVKLK